MASKIIERIKSLGFEHMDTGGGCIAYVSTTKDGFDIVLTDSGGLNAPSLTDFCVGFYLDRDWQPEGCRYWFRTDGTLWDCIAAAQVHASTKGK